MSEEKKEEPQLLEEPDITRLDGAVAMATRFFGGEAYEISFAVFNQGTRFSVTSMKLLDEIHQEDEQQGNPLAH